MTPMTLGSQPSPGLPPPARDDPGTKRGGKPRRGSPPECAGGRERETGAGEDVEAEVAAAFGPFVVLLGQDGADEADEGVTGREDPDDVGAPAERSRSGDADAS